MEKSRVMQFFKSFFFLSLLLLCQALFAAQVAAQADFSGMWMPVPELSQQWQESDMPLTATGAEVFTDFVATRHDSTGFCMPYGTPRNTLNTAPDPIEIIQKSTQITLLFDRLGDVRRIFMDKDEQPEDPIPSWMGHSIGAWHNNVLRVDTIAMTEESILSDDGFPHSEYLHMVEEFSLVEIAQETLLKIELTLTDPDYYSSSINTVRYFRRAPYAQMSVGSALCLLDQWRERLEFLNREQYQLNAANERSSEGE